MPELADEDRGYVEVMEGKGGCWDATLFLHLHDIPK